MRVKSPLRAFLLLFLPLAGALAAREWIIFKGQVNGPAVLPDGIDVESFRLKQYPGLFTTEVYYHHMNFPDGSMITVQFGFNRTEANIIFVYGRPGQEPFTDFLICDAAELKPAEKGFAFSVGKNRVQLEGSTYLLELALPKTKAKITYNIIGPSYTYGDGMVRYPDGHTYMYYSLPISWAKVEVEAVLDGKNLKLTGSGDMNHDAGVIFPGWIPSNWQAFWFFGDDHRLSVTDHYTHAKFGRELIQRLVFVRQDGRMFTSTSFRLDWEEWEKVKDIRFRYPRHYRLVAEAGGEKLEGEVTLKETILLEDLYSNVPEMLQAVAKYLTPNGWTIDSWAEYTLHYSHDGRTETFSGRGVVRWTNLEEE